MRGRRHAQLDQLADLVPALRDHPVHGAGRAPARSAIRSRRAGVRGALVSALDRAQRVIGLHHRHPARRGRRGRRPARSSRSARARRPASSRRRHWPPASRRTRACTAAARPWAAGRGGPAGTCTTVTPSASRTALRRVGRVPSGVDAHVVALRGERGGQLGHVRVLAAGVLAAERGQRAGVLRDHRDAHVFLLQQPVPVGEEPVQAVPGPGDPPGPLAQPVRRVRARRAASGPRRRSVSTRVESDAGVRGHGGHRLRGGQRDHRHAQRHRLDQAQPERGPPAQVQVGPPPGQLACISACGRSSYAVSRSGGSPAGSAARRRPCRRRPAAPPRRSRAAGRCR